MTIDEGVIKFDCRWQPGPAPPGPDVAKLNSWRDRLYGLGLVGFDREHAVGFGNMSTRTADGSVVITASQTGHIATLEPGHYVRIVDYDIEANRVSAVGPMRPSSETLTHLSIYRLDDGIKAVFHVHEPVLWKRLLHKVPTTAADVAYGTPAMAMEFTRLFAGADLRRPQLVAMAGHPAGLVGFGATLDAAGQAIVGARG